MISQEATVKKTWMDTPQTPFKTVALVRTCLGTILAIACLTVSLEHSMEEGTALIFSWAVPTPSK